MRDTRRVQVADREADPLAMMARARALGTLADWLETHGGTVGADINGCSFRARFATVTI